MTSRQTRILSIFFKQSKQSEWHVKNSHKSGILTQNNESSPHKELVIYYFILNLENIEFLSLFLFGRTPIPYYKT